MVFAESNGILDRMGLLLRSSSRFSHSRALFLHFSSMRNSSLPHYFWMLRVFLFFQGFKKKIFKFQHHDLTRSARAQDYRRHSQEGEPFYYQFAGNSVGKSNNLTQLFRNAFFWVASDVIDKNKIIFNRIIFFFRKWSIRITDTKYPEEQEWSFGFVDIFPENCIYFVILTQILWKI